MLQSRAGGISPIVGFGVPNPARRRACEWPAAALCGRARAR